MSKLYSTLEEQQLAEASIPSLVRKFAIPGVFALLFAGLQSIIDGYFLGNYVGANALASVTLIMPCYTLITALAIVCGIGCQTLVSMALGRRDYPEANHAMASGFWGLLLITSLLSVILYLLAPYLANLMGANDALRDDSISYLRNLLPFFPLIAQYFLADYMLKAMGKPIYSMLAMASAVVLNIILDYLFVVELRWGISGAAFATGLAFSAGAFIAGPMIWGVHKILSVFKGRFHWSLLGRMLYNGSSEGLSELSAGISMFLFNITLMHYWGEKGVSAFAAINYVYFTGLMIFLGISDGIIPILSYNHGAEQHRRVRKTLFFAARVIFSIGLCLSLVLWLFPEQFISIFFQGDVQDVKQIAVAGARIYAVAFLFSGLNILTSGYFTALGNAHLSVIVAALRGLLLLGAFILLLPQLIGVDGIWLSVPLAEFCTLIISFLLIRRSFQKKLKARKSRI